MTRKDYTDVTVILDRSGSMTDIRSDMEGGFNQFIENQKKLPGTCKVTLVQFDFENGQINIDTIYTAKSIQEVPPLTLIPRGATPLTDAVGATVTKTGERLSALPEHERPGNVLVLVITDGRENSSKEFSKEQVVRLTDRQEKDYNWGFMYLGANVNAFDEAKGLGIPTASSAPFSPTPQSVGAAFAAINLKLSAYRSTGDKKSLSYTDKERDDIKNAGATSKTRKTPPTPSGKH